MASGLSRRIGVVALGRAVSTLSIFAVYAVLARHWPAAECGLFTAVWVLANTLVPIFLLGLPTTLLYFFPLRNQRRALVWQVAASLLLSALLLVALLYFWGPHLAGLLGEGRDPAPFLRPFLPYIFSLVAGGFVEAALVASGRETWQALLALVAAVGLVGAAVLGAVQGWGLEGVAAAFSLLGLGRLLAGAWLVGRAVRGGSGWTRQGWGEVLAYARPVGLGEAIGSLSRFVDRYVVLYFFSAASFAPYQFGAVELPVALLLAAVVSVLVPEISRLYQEGRLEAIGALWREAVGRLALFVLPLFAFFFSFSEPVFALYMPEGYASAEWVFRVFLLALPLRCAIYNPLLVGMGKARWALWGSAGDLLLNLVLSVVLVRWLMAHYPQWALLGPAWATVLATYAQVFFLVAAIARHLRWRFSQLLPWGRLLRLGTTSMGAALVGRWAASGAAGAAAELFWGGLVFCLVLGALLWGHPGERREVRALLSALLRN